MDRLRGPSQSASALTTGHRSAPDVAVSGDDLAGVISASGTLPLTRAGKIEKAVLTRELGLSPIASAGLCKFRGCEQEPRPAMMVAHGSPLSEALES